jgi:hypothetical protein
MLLLEAGFVKCVKGGSSSDPKRTQALSGRKIQVCYNLECPSEVTVGGRALGELLVRLGSLA